MSVGAGDTVRVLGHRNAFDEDISTWRPSLFKVGETFVVGNIEEDDDSGYNCPLVYPVGEQSDFWREDDLEVVTRNPAASDFAIRVKELREQGHGLHDAKRLVRREEQLRLLDQAKSLDDLKGILRDLIGGAA